MDLSTLTQQQFEELKQQIEKEEKTRNFMSKLFKDMSPELLAYLLGHVPDLSPFNRFSRELVNREREQGFRVQSIRLPWKSSWFEILDHFEKYPTQHKICLYIGAEDEDQILYKSLLKVPEIYLRHNISLIQKISYSVTNLIEFHLSHFNTFIKRRMLDDPVIKQFGCLILRMFRKLKVLHLKNSMEVLPIWMQQQENMTYFFHSLEVCIVENENEYVNFLKFFALTCKTLKFLKINKMEIRQQEWFFERISEGPELVITTLHLTENNFSDLLVPSLISSIKKFPHLTELDLSRNKFSQNSIEAIKQNLSPNTIFYAKDQKIRRNYST